MAEELHKVVLYVHDGLKSFTVTARTDSARLGEVTRQMIGKGYTTTLVAHGLPKEEAEALKDRIRAEYIAKGYSYEIRKALS
jgi:hypothetical protein